MTEKVVIGLTGNIATGKSLVLRMLQELGATVIDADKVAHQSMGAGSPIYQEIVEEFGKFVLDAEGQIDREKLGKIVFSLPEALARLEAITHPAVRQHINQAIANSNTDVVVVEAIKLFESGLAEQCNSNWVVTAPPEIQLKRLVERRKMPREQAIQRIKAQPPAEEKVARSDVVIDNSGELAKTWTLVKKQYTTLLEKQAGLAQIAAAETEATAPAPQAAPVSMVDITIRRAKRADLDAMAQVIATGTKGALNPDMSEMMEAIFSRGYIIAMAGEYMVGMAGWQTENLIAGLQDFYVLRDELWPTVGQTMLDRIHKEVDKLSCEVSIVFVLNQAGPKAVEFFESQGYEQAEGKDLGYMWKDAALEWQLPNSILLYKKLREQRIMVPM